MTERVNHERVFLIFVYVQTTEGTWYYLGVMSFIGEEAMETT